MWMTAEEALRRLKSKPQSLYANVSRGRVRAKPDPADQRRSLYFAEDVDRLAARSRGRRPAHTVAAEAVSWGEPVLASSISTVRDGRLSYRGADAAELARTATLEQTAALLWNLPQVVVESRETPVSPSIETLFVTLAKAAAVEPSVAGQGGIGLAESAVEVLSAVADAMAGGGEGAIHLRLARRWRREEAGDGIRRALVLLADHELNASTFAARVAVSTGASLWAGALAGLATLTGPRHGTAAREVRALAGDIGSDGLGAEAALRDWLGEGRQVPGFGHRLYPDGDIRARAMLEGFVARPVFATFLGAAETLTGEAPNVDFALAALADRYDLPDEAPLTLFALGRSVGWLAHMMEQIRSGQLIRPRARYVGP